MAGMAGARRAPTNEKEPKMAKQKRDAPAVNVEIFVS